MTLSQGYQMAQAATYKQPCLDYPYLGIPDIDEETIDLMEQDYIYEQLAIEDEIH